RSVRGDRRRTMHRSFVPQGAGSGGNSAGGRGRRPIRTLAGRAALVCMLVLAPVSSVAWAAEAVTEDAEPSPERLAQARRLFAEGQLRMERGEWVAAGKRFREAARIKDTPGLRYYMAVCEESLGRLLEAQRQYEEARR